MIVKVVLQHVSNIIFTVTVTTLPMFQTQLPQGAAEHKFEARVPKNSVASHCCNYCLTTPKLHFIKQKISTHLQNAFLPTLQALLTNANERVLLQKSVLAQLAKKFPASYGTERFITVLSRTCHWSSWWNTKIQYCAFKNLPLVILSQMNPVYLLTPLLTDDLPIYV